MECFTKLCMAVVCYVYVFTLETAEQECIDLWPYCYAFNLPCLNHTDWMEVYYLCPKRCGLCPSSENDSSSVNVTCRDKIDCSPFNLREGCQSNTWYREHCRKSCNMCLFENETATEGYEIRDINSAIKTEINLYHNSPKDVQVAGRERWEIYIGIIISVIGIDVFIIFIFVGIIVYFAFVKNRKEIQTTEAPYGQLNIVL